MNDALAGYLAGFFDGEGSVYAAIRWNKSKTERKASPTLLVCITNTHKDVIDYHKELFGGSVARRVKGGPANPKWRDQWQWVLCSRMAEPYLKAIAPHVIVKKAVVEVAIQYAELMKTPRGERMDYSNLALNKSGKMTTSPLIRPEYQAKVLALHSRIRELNQRGAPGNALRQRNAFEQAQDAANVAA